MSNRPTDVLAEVPPRAAPIKVLHVAHDPEVYGIGKMLYDLVRCQHESVPEIDPAVAFHVAGPRSADFQKLGVRIYESPCDSARSGRLLPWFRSLFPRFDVVNFHTHSPWGFLAAGLCRSAVVNTFHGTLGLRQRRTDFAVRFYHRFIAASTSRCITFASRAAVDRYLHGVGGTYRSNKMKVFPYGIQLDQVKAQRTREESRQLLGMEDRFLVGTAARMDPVKRLDRLIQAIALLPDRKRFELLIMGDGDTAYQRSLVDLAAQLGVESKVHFLGYRSDVLDIVQALDLFVLPSQQEAMGMALLEAMALGVPSAVFADGGGPVDIVGERGMIARQPDDLCQYIIRLAGDEQERTAAAQYAQRRVQQFDILATAAHFCDIYQTCVKSA